MMMLQIILSFDDFFQHNILYLKMIVSSFKIQLLPAAAKFMLAI